MAVPPEVQLGWFSSALEELENFLLSRDTFRPLPNAPQGMRQDLSLGGILLARDTLQACEGELSSPSRTEWSRLRARWEKERSGHAAAVERKAKAELPTRINLWRAYLGELGEKPDEARAYPTEVRHRVLIARLPAVMADHGSTVHPDLADLDRWLHAWLKAGSFIWPKPLISVYPPAEFWFLYGTPDPARIRNRAQK